MFQNATFSVPSAAEAGRAATARRVIANAQAYTRRTIRLNMARSSEIRIVVSGAEYRDAACLCIARPFAVGRGGTHLARCSRDNAQILEFRGIAGIVRINSAIGVAIAR